MTKYLYLAMGVLAYAALPVLVTVVLTAHPGYAVGVPLLAELMAAFRAGLGAALDWENWNAYPRALRVGHATLVLTLLALAFAGLSLLELAGAVLLPLWAGYGIGAFAARTGSSPLDP